MVEIVNTVDRIDVEAVNKADRRKLYKARVKIHPKRAEGFYRRLKWIIMGVTLAIYYITPWLRWDRGPYAPDQAVLVDIAHRRFYFFFIEIWPQEFYYVAGLLIMAGLGLFLVTTAVGRAWCGYSCPQTVWTDLYVAVERWVEGDRNARIKLDAAPWSFDKLRKRALKMAIWLVIGLVTGGAWIFYFADAPTLLSQFIRFEAPPIAYSTVAVLTATTFVFAGFMREQVCTYMCPWPRIQAAMFDEDSLIVTYNAWRGEPRSRHLKSAEKAGDCIDCNACVAVCPAGIDIRDGDQLECISCALCIDACDAVMKKIGRPQGLISYSTLKTYKSNAQGKPAVINWQSLLRPRLLIYGALWVAVGIGMLIALMLRERLDINVLHDRNPLYVTLSSGAIRDGYTVKILNMEPHPRKFQLSLDGLPAATMTAVGSDAAPAREITVDVEADKLHALKIYVSAPVDALSGAETPFAFVIREEGAEDTTSRSSAVFHGPQK